MKLTDKAQRGEMLRPGWKLYDQCAGHIGTILDNQFKDPHLSVYEHVRHTATEVFKHPTTFGDTTYPAPSMPDAGESFEEELNIANLLASTESRRRLNVIGDVGVGKTTFLRHLMDRHVGRTPGFGEGKSIYISWADFTATSVNPMEDIKKRFVMRVSAELEAKLGLRKIIEIDDRLFETAELFAEARVVAERMMIDGSGDVAAHKTRSVAEAGKTAATALTFARINQLCIQDPNALTLLIDNIDHLPQQVQQELSRFLVELQVSVVPLIIVAMRDHTFYQGFSMYQENRAVPCWNVRLKPPNIKLMLKRRIDYFFPKPAPGQARHTVQVGAGILRMDQDTAEVCSTMLNSPLSDMQTYEFICSYANYSIRDLFGTLQSIVGSPGYAGLDRNLFLQRDGQFRVGIDECLIALGLGQYLLFFPDQSPLFNPYSSGADDHPLDKIVAPRILQLLDNRTLPIAFKELSERLVSWGYSRHAIDTQTRAMVNKDLIWTSTGAPSQFCKESEIRLSYRGQLYARRILRRTVFNYMMSFDIEAPDESHPVFRHHRSEYKKELESFANFTEKFDSAAAAERVLGLAEIVAHSERQEAKQLLSAREMDVFRSDVAPKALCLGVVEGLEKFLLSTLAEKGESKSRFIAPTTAIMRRVGDAKSAYAQEFRRVYPQ